MDRKSVVATKKMDRAIEEENLFQNKEIARIVWRDWEGTDWGLKTTIEGKAKLHSRHRS